LIVALARMLKQIEAEAVDAAQDLAAAS